MSYEMRWGLHELTVSKSNIVNKIAIVEGGKIILKKRKYTHILSNVYWGIIYFAIRKGKSQEIEVVVVTIWRKKHLYGGNGGTK